MPETDKQYLRLAMTARSAGLGPEEADREARRRLDADEQARTKTPQPAPPPASTPPAAVKAKRAARPRPPCDEAAHAAQVRQARDAERDGAFLSRPGRALSPARRR